MRRKISSDKMEIGVVPLRLKIIICNMAKGSDGEPIKWYRSIGYYDKRSVN